MKGGFHVSTKQSIIIIGLMVVIVVCVGLMAGLIKESCPDLEDNGGGEVSTTTTSTTGPEVTTPGEQGPWTHPFLPENTVPVHYDLWLYPDFYFDGSTYTGRVSITINITEDTHYLIVHVKMMNVTGTRVFDGATELTVARAWEYVDNQFWVVETAETMTAGSTVSLRLDFASSLVNGIVGFYKSTYVNTNTGVESWLATAKFQPTDARKAFPCFDEPEHKTTFTVTLKHWANFTALGNMPEDFNITVDNGWKETTFQITPIMSCYLVCFIVTDFKYRENILSNGVPHRIWTSEDKLDQAEYALQAGKEQADWFMTEMNMDYHLPKLDQVAVPDYPSGATEHWGLITYREANLLYNASTVAASGKERVALIIGHELAHNYFGNLVTCDWWDEIWLNEGFASFYEFTLGNVSEPSWELEDYFSVRTLQGALVDDAGASSRPLIIELTHPDEINAAFDGVTYNKGSSMLRMIQDFMGKERFRNAVREYLVTHQYDIVETPDLWAAFQKEMGSELDITAVMATWTLQMGFPVVEISQPEPGKLKATPKRFLSNPNADASEPPSDYNYEWFIPLSYVTPTNSYSRIWVNRTEVIFDDPRSAGEWIKFNVKQAGFYRVNYPADMWEELSDILLDNPDELAPVERASILDDAFSLARATQLDYTTALNLTRYMASETHYFPWKTTVGALDYIVEMMYGHQHYNLLRQYIRDITEQAMSTVKVEDGGEHLDQMLRTDIIRMACGNGNTECLQNVTRMFAWWLEDPIAFPVPATLRQIVYRIGMEESGDEPEWNELWNRYLTTSAAQEKLYLLDALAHTPHLWLIQRYLDYCMDETKVRTQDFFSAVAYASNNPIGSLYVWDWARIHYDELIERFGVSDRYFGNMVPSMVSGFNTEFQLQEVLDFFEKYPDAGAGASNRGQALESIRANIEWVKLNEADIVDWLDDNA